MSGRKGRRLADSGDEKIVGARVGASALYIIWILSGAHEGGIAVIFITTVAQSLFLLFFCQTGKKPTHRPRLCVDGFGFRKRLILERRSDPVEQPMRKRVHGHTPLR